ncbi:MAG: nascent polypeptide-associated complex protein [Nanoarchaeota archaeon]
MLGGLGGLNPKKMQEMMKKIGMDQEEISASRVIIEKQDGEKIFIENPSVTKIKIQGQESFQIAGDISKETENIEGSFSELDVKTVIDKTGSTKKQAVLALENSRGDLAEAILRLSSGEVVN